jgi:hypothetical protein
MPKKSSLSTGFGFAFAGELLQLPDGQRLTKNTDDGE